MMEADQNGDGKLDFEEFKAMVANTDIAKQMVRSSPLPSSTLTNPNTLRLSKASPSSPPPRITY